MIIFKDNNADMFMSGADILVNPVNTHGGAAGLHGVFARKFPEQEALYREDCDSGLLKIGTVTSHSRGAGKHILYFPSKENPRYPSKMEFILIGLAAMREELHYIQNVEGDKIESIAIPALGCGLGGLAWEPVKKVITGALEDLDMTIYLYEPKELEPRWM